MSNIYSACLLILILVGAFALGFFLEPVQSREALPSEWLAEYYANPRFFGQPSIITGDEVIDMNWSSGSPNGKIPNNYFSVRWTRQVALVAGVYRFRIGADDRCRLLINGKLVLAAQQKGTFQTITLDLALEAGVYIFEVQYVEERGRAGVLMDWEAVPADPLAEVLRLEDF